MSEVNVAAALGSESVMKALETVDNKVITDIARKILAGSLATPLGNFKLEGFDKAGEEIGPFAAVAIGFAAGAAARLVGKKEFAASASSNEMFPVVVAAFLAGAAAGSRAVDGKL